MSSLIGISKYLFCPVCFRNKKKFSALKCYIVEDQIHLCECIYCKNYWEIRALKEEFERLEEEIETFEIHSIKGMWNFRKESLRFRNKTLSHLSHSLFEIKTAKTSFIDDFQMELNKLVS